MYRYFTDLDFRWAIQGGLKCCRFKSIRHKSFLLLSIRYAGSRFARHDSVRIKLRCNMRIEWNHKVPLTNQLSLGILDIDAYERAPERLQPSVFFKIFAIPYVC